MKSKKSHEIKSVEITDEIRAQGPNSKEFKDMILAHFKRREKEMKLIMKGITSGPEREKLNAL